MVREGVRPSQMSAATKTALIAKLSPQSCIVVETTSNAKTNGAALIAAYTAAKALTPNGEELSATNRACVILPPAKYDLDHVDAPAPSGITITPDDVGSNPVTWYYRVVYGMADQSERGLVTEESSFTVGDSTTSIIVDGGTIPDWAEVLCIILGTVQGGIKEYIVFPFITSFPTDIFGTISNPGYGDLYTQGLLLVPVHQDCVPLTLDTEFVDIIGLTTDRSLQQIYGTPEATNSGVIVQTADDVHVSNLYVKILTEKDKRFSVWNDTDSAAYFPSTSLSNTVVDNCQFDGQDGSNDEGPRLFSMRLYIEYSGTFNNCTGGNFAFGGAGGTASGTFTNCTGGDYSFGGAGGTASGTFTNCTGGDYSFGGGGTASGTFTNCTGGEAAFGGDSGTASGTFNYCTGGEAAFGGDSGTASGTFTNCTGGDYSFGGAGGTLSGQLYYCRLTTGSFQTLAEGGKLRACVDGSDTFIATLDYKAP